MSVRVTLIPSYQSWNLPKDKLLQLFPHSLLAQSIEEDLTATEINITNPAVKPVALDLIATLLEDSEPNEPVYGLYSSADYLNMPELLIYSNNYYGTLDHPTSDTKKNREVLTNAAEEGDTEMVAYLLRKDVNPVEE